MIKNKGGAKFKDHCGKNPVEVMTSLLKIMLRLRVNSQGKLGRHIGEEESNILTIIDLNNIIRYAYFKKGEKLDNGPKQIRDLIINSSKAEKVEFINKKIEEIKLDIEFINFELSDLGTVLTSGSSNVTEIQKEEIIAQITIARKYEYRFPIYNAIRNILKRYLYHDVTERPEEINLSFSTKKKSSVKEEGEISHDEFCVVKDKATMKKRFDRDLEVCKKTPFFSEEFCKNVYMDKLTRLENEVEPTYSSELPPITDEQFNEKITDYFSGKTGPCNYNVDGKSTKNGCIGRDTFFVQQRFIADYFAPRNPYRGLLVYHAPGTGKSKLCAAVIGKYIQSQPERAIIFITKPTLINELYRELFEVDYKLYTGMTLSDSLSSSEKKEKVSQLIQKHVYITSYQKLANRLKGFTKWDSPFNVSLPQGKEGIAAVPKNTQREDSDRFPLFNNTLVIIDEAHNLTSPQNGIQQRFWTSVSEPSIVMESLRRAENIKILLLTATPMKVPYEIGILMNLLKHKNDPNTFPVIYKRINSAFSHEDGKTSTETVEVVSEKRTESAFNDIFMDSDGNIKNKELFMNLTKGLVSYFNNIRDESLYPKVLPWNDVVVDMSEKQLNEYFKVRRADHVNMKKNTSAANPSCRGVKVCSASRGVSNLIEPVKTKELTLANLQIVGPKLAKMVENVDNLQPKGKQVIFSSIDTARGIGAISRALQDNGWTQLKSDDLRDFLITGDKKMNDFFIRSSAFPPEEKVGGLESILDMQKVNSFMSSTSQKRFIVLGANLNNEPSAKNNADEETNVSKKLLVSFFNMQRLNLRGDFINAVIINKKYSEGISFFNVRNFHFLEPPLSITDIRQAVARGIRACSHKFLEFPEEWNISVYSYFSTHPVFQSKPTTGGTKKKIGGKNKKEVTNFFCHDIADHKECNSKEYCNYKDGQCLDLPIDFAIQKMAKKTASTTDMFLQMLKLNAIDCEIFSKLNDDNGKCFMPPPEDDREEVLSSEPDSEQSEAVINSTQKGCEEINEKETCNGEDKCFWVNGAMGIQGMCRTLGPKHQQCNAYHQTKTKCNADPFCVWRTDNSVLQLQTPNPQCHNLYPSEFSKYKFAVGLSYYHDHVYNVVELLGMSDSDMEEKFKEIIRRFNEDTNLIIENELSKLLDLLRLNFKLVINRLIILRNALKKHQALNPDEWKDKNVESIIKSISQYYEKRTANQQAKSNQQILVVDFGSCPNCELVDLKSTRHKKPMLDYVIKLVVNNKEYFFSSTSIDDAPLSLINIEYFDEINKEINLFDIKVILTFKLVNGVLIKLFVTVQKQLETSDPNSLITKLVNEDDVILSLNRDKCLQVWKEKNLGYPPDTSSISEMKYEIDDCWWKFKSKYYSMPESWKEKHLQYMLADSNNKLEVATAKQCYSNVVNTECQQDDDCHRKLTTVLPTCKNHKWTNNYFTCKSSIPGLFRKKCVPNNIQLNQ
jgi:hypothetical protein